MILLDSGNKNAIENISLSEQICDRKENPIIIESLFRETTRTGKHTIRLVLLALTRKLLIIAYSHSFGLSTQKSDWNCQSILEIRSLHPLDSLKIAIFKKSKRQTLKVCFHNKYDRYFELEKSCGTDELWAIWCENVLKSQQEIVRNKSSKNSLDKTTSFDEDIFHEQAESHRITWNDKYLYLGSKREIDDKNRPIPVRGLGPSEDIKLLNLKPQYFGCWGQTEHWVQCESSKLLNMN